MSKDLPVQVEVNVQDYFYESENAENDSFSIKNSSSAADATQESSNPISPETWENWICTWLETLRPDFSPIQQYELSLRLTDDAEMQSLNAQYRQKDQPTDVLAFAALEVDYPELDDSEEVPLYLGDIVISVETAQHQARDRQHSLHHELAWLTAHGLLHLLGWDHPDEESLLQMLKQQDILLQTVGFKSEYDGAA